MAIALCSSRKRISVLSLVFTSLSTALFAFGSYEQIRFAEFPEKLRNLDFRSLSQEFIDSESHY